MAVIAPTPIAAAPPVPDSSLDEPTFDAQYEEFNAYEADTLVPGMNALAENVYANAQAAETAAMDSEAAQAAAELAQAAAEAAQVVVVAAEATATAAASTATTQAGISTTQAGISTTQAGTATTAAGTATTKAAEAAASAAAAEVFATQQLKASSSTTLTPGAGTKNFTIETGRSFVAGMYLVATSSGAPSNAMSGYVISYDIATGALSIGVDYFSGASSRSDWVIGVAAPGASAAGLTRSVVSTNTTCVAGVAYIVDTAGIVLTLPTSWTAGDQIAIVESIGFGAQYTINFGTTPLRKQLPGSQVIDASFGSTGVLTYQDATQGLV